MSAVNVTGVLVKNNPCSLSDPFCFEITFESLSDLKEDLDWRVIYCTSGDVDTCKDVELDCVSLGPVTTGTLSFEFQAAPPNYAEMDPLTLVGINAVLVTASYRGDEFIRIGWYLNNMYVDAELKENPPAIPLMSKLVRLILDDDPRVTRFPVNWDAVNPELLQPEGIQDDVISGVNMSSSCSLAMGTEGSSISSSSTDVGVSSFSSVSNSKSCNSIEMNSNTPVDLLQSKMMLTGGTTLSGFPSNGQENYHTINIADPIHRSELNNAEIVGMSKAANIDEDVTMN